MKELNDEEIQKMLEQQFSVPDRVRSERTADLKITDEGDKDRVLYEKLFNILEQEPDAGPSYAFSSKVKLRLATADGRRNDYRFHVALMLIFLTCAAAVWGILSVIDYSYGTEIRSVFVDYKGVFIFGFACFFFIQYLDQRAVKGLKPGA